MAIEQPRTVLTDYQAQRAEAVERAARSLAQRAVLGPPKEQPDAAEVEALAEFIVKGERQLWATFDRQRPDDDEDAGGSADLARYGYCGNYYGDTAEVAGTVYCFRLPGHDSTQHAGIDLETGERVVWATEV